MTTLTIEITDTLDEKVTDVAKRSNLSKEQLAEKALEDFVERQAKNGDEDMRSKASRVLREAGLTSPLNLGVTKKDILSEEERQRLGKLFSGERPLGDYIDEDREARG